MTNLVTNAVKYAPGKPTEVSVARQTPKAYSPSATMAEASVRRTANAYSGVSSAPPTRGRAAASTVEALLYSLRAGGAALACPHARRRMAELTEAQLHEVSARLQKIDPNIARAWTPIEVELLVGIWMDMHG